jgi:sugar/nucleoside kinase (ribokinase family)
VTSYTYAMTARATGRRTFFHQRGANALLAPDDFDFGGSRARIFMLGYLMLLDALDAWVAPGVTAAAQVLARARAAGLTTVVDLVSLAHPQFGETVRSALPHVDHLMLNELEASMLLGLPPAPATSAELLAAAREIAREGVGSAVVIHCEGGVIALDCRTGDEFVHGAAALPDALIAGATGAGDAFAAGYIWALHAGESLADRLRAGVCCAAACLREASASGGLRPLAECLALGSRFGFRRFAVG